VFPGLLVQLGLAVVLGLAVESTISLVVLAVLLVPVPAAVYVATGLIDENERLVVRSLLRR